MNKKIIVICLIITLLVVSTVFYIVNFEEKTTSLEDNSQIITLENFSKTDNSIIEHVLKNDFTLAMSYSGMDHGDIITIQGTTPKSNTSITGMIIHNKDKLNVTIVQVFQLTADENGFYTHNVTINDDYLWTQEGLYTVSVQNEGKYKELVFHRR